MFESYARSPAWQRPDAPQGKDHLFQVHSPCVLSANILTLSPRVLRLGQQSPICWAATGPPPTLLSAGAVGEAPAQYLFFSLPFQTIF